MDPFEAKMPPAVSRPSADNESLPLEEPALRWEKEDIEQRFGFTGGRYTGVNRLLSFMIALACTLGFFMLIHLVLRPMPEPPWVQQFAAKFWDRGITPYPTMFLFFWGCVILFIKARKLAYQRRALALMPVPQNPDFVLTPETAKVVLRRIDSLVDSSTHFILLNRIHNAISNLKNIGSVGDVTNVLKSQSENDDDLMQSSYSLLAGFNWGIPVLGFIGTVLGLGDAIGGFGTTLASAGGGNFDALKDSLKVVIAGLSTSFDTTLIALVAALFMQLRLTFLQQQEYAFLDDCNDYCQKYVVSRLKLIERSDG
ncbi:MAG TPA: MotA/TolQ/ExbB proton channel family protein [Prosthecobacter sp.]|jgi:biopolymer transport protein ExbB/TolQ|nr:MotA/TolQ/ExbB proton channel family protein [Prosthecobacter sp.]